jgi:putative alpha-1,2-mannosidase
MYRPTPDGLSGNDDCGQMSAWYIFSALGFYPMEPGSDRYELGAPVVERATIPLPDGTTFSVVTTNQGAKQPFVEAACFLNGKVLDRRYITHEEIMAGGELHFEMTPDPPMR